MKTLSIQSWRRYVPLGDMHNTSRRIRTRSYQTRQSFNVDSAFGRGPVAYADGAFDPRGRVWSYSTEGA